MSTIYNIKIQNTSNNNIINSAFNDKQILIYELTKCFEDDIYFREINWKDIIKRRGGHFSHYKIKINKLNLNSKLILSSPITNNHSETLMVESYNDEKSLFKIKDNNIIVKIGEADGIIAVGKLNKEGIIENLSEEDLHYVETRGIIVELK